MNDTPKDEPKAHPKADAEGGGGKAERLKREKNDGSLVNENHEKESGVPMPVPPPPD